MIMMFNWYYLPSALIITRLFFHVYCGNAHRSMSYVVRIFHFSVLLGWTLLRLQLWQVFVGGRELEMLRPRWKSCDHHEQRHPHIPARQHHWHCWGSTSWGWQRLLDWCLWGTEKLLVDLAHRYPTPPPPFFSHLHRCTFDHFFCILFIAIMHKSLTSSMSSPG